MAFIINHVPILPAAVIPDFGWFYGDPASPQREPEYTYTANMVSYPPGHTTTSGTFTVPTIGSTADMNVTSTDSFDMTTDGHLIINNGIDWTLLRYTNIVGNVFKNCSYIAGTTTFTYASDVSVWDPRFYVDSAPLQQPVTFDAQDYKSLGLNTTFIPPGIRVLQWRWDFGNGHIGFGPHAETTYPFDMPPSSIKVTLSVFDSDGRHFSCSHPLILLPLSVMELTGGSTTRFGG